ncbi:MAG: condensation domain-containing protein [Myxococcota bacterium]
MKVASDASFSSGLLTLKVECRTPVADFELLTSGPTADGAPDLHDLTFYQRRFWQMEKAFPNTSGYVLAGLLRSPAFEDAELLRKAVQATIEDNDATRLRMRSVPGGVRQYVRQPVADEVAVLDFAQAPESMREWIQKTSTTPFVMEDSDLFYTAVLRLGAREHGVFIKAHHLVGDEWSSRLLARQISDRYALLRGGERPTSQTRHSYLDYVRSEEEYLRSDRFVKHRAYWENRFGDLPEDVVARVSVPVDDSQKTSGFQVCQLSLAPHAAALEQEQVSLLCVSLAAFARYFKTVKQQEDVVFGLPTYNRVTHQERNTIGMFANSALLRVTMDANADHRAVVDTVRSELHYLLKYQRYPYPLLKQFIEEKYGFKGHLYQTYVSFAQSEESDYQVEYFIKHTQYCPLIVRIYHQAARNQVAFHFYYWKEDYSPQDIERLFEFVSTQFNQLATAA